MGLTFDSLFLIICLFRAAIKSDQFLECGSMWLCMLETPSTYFRKSIDLQSQTWVGEQSSAMPFTMLFWAFVPFLIAISLFFFVFHSGGKSGVSKKTDGVKVGWKSDIHLRSLILIIVLIDLTSWITLFCYYIYIIIYHRQQLTAFCVFASESLNHSDNRFIENTQEQNIIADWLLSLFLPYHVKVQSSSSLTLGLSVVSMHLLWTSSHSVAKVNWFVEWFLPLTAIVAALICRMIPMPLKKDWYFCSLHCNKDWQICAATVKKTNKQDFLIFWTINPEPYVLKTRAVLGSVGIWAGLL